MSTDDGRTEMADVHALTTVRPQGMAERAAESGIARLARMSEDNFAEHLELMRVGYNRLKEVQRSLMRPGVHYGMPGAKPEDMKKLAEEGKVGLYKAGAELLCQMLGCVAGTPQLKIEYGDPENTTSPSIVVHATVPVHRGDASGPVVGVGVGAWSTWEVKNRYRTAKRTCPDCGKPTLMQQNEAKGGRFKGMPAFWCVPSRDGCGHDFAGDDPRIVDQKIGREPNTDAADLLNTGVKMGTKRAFVDGTIRASGSSDLFTQDLEDLSPEQLARRDREVESGAKATTDAMYGSDPDAWRTETAGATAAPAKPQPATQAPAAANGTEPAPATEKQRAAAWALLKAKLGVLTDPAADVALKVRFNLPGGLAGLTKAQATATISALNKMPEYVEGSAPAVAAPTTTAEGMEFSREGAVVDNIQNRNWGMEKTRQVAALAEANLGRTILSAEGGVLMLCGSVELQVMGLTKKTPLEYLDAAQLLKLVQHLRNELERSAARS